MEHSINLGENNLQQIKKRLLFVITQSEMGGAQRFLYNLVTNLNANKYKIEVCTGNDGVDQEKSDLITRLAKINSIRVSRLANLFREIKPISDIRAVFEIRKKIIEFKPDVLFLNSSKTGFVGSLASVFPYKIKRIKVIYRIGGWTFNDPWSVWKKKLWMWIEKISAKWKDIIIVNNKQDYNQAEKLAIKPRQNIQLIHNGVDISKLEAGFLSKEESQSKLGIPHEYVAVGTIANFYLTKGLSYLLDSAYKIRKEHEKLKFKFVIIGDGIEKKIIESKIAEKNMENDFILPGQLSDAWQYIKAFDIFVLPSVKEGFPWALIEAMAAKLPAIATSVGAIPEIIDDSKSGYIVPPKNPVLIAEKIIELGDNFNLREKLGNNAHQKIKEKFELKNMVSQIENLF